MRAQGSRASGESMGWDDLLRHHRDFNAGLYKAEITYFAASRVLRDFPTQLLPRERAALMRTVEGLGRSIVRMIATGRSAHARVDQLHLAVINLISLQVTQPDPPSGPDFSGIPRVPREQLLVATISLLEVYLLQSHAAIIGRPGALGRAESRTASRRGKAPSGGIDRGSLEERLQAMRVDLELQLTLTPDEIGEFDRIREIRHAIVHHGGRASQEFLRRTGRADLAEGADVACRRGHRGEAGLSCATSRRRCPDGNGRAALRTRQTGASGPALAPRGDQATGSGSPVAGGGPSQSPANAAVATIVHSDESLPAVGFIFTVHFYNTPRTKSGGLRVPGRARWSRRPDRPTPRPWLGRAPEELHHGRPTPPGVIALEGRPLRVYRGNSELLEGGEFDQEGGRDADG